jgi:zinc protease
VVAVGDFTAGEMIARIEELFGAIPAREDPRPRENPPVPLDHAPLARVTTDAEATRTTVDVMWKHAPDTAITVADLDDQLTLGLALDMLRQRLAERAQEADPPFAMAFGGDRRQVRTMSALAFTAITEEGKAMRALEALATELARVRRHGFTTGELERARARTLRQLERQVQEGDKTESRRWAFRYMRHALYGGPLLSAEASLQYGRQLLPRISRDAASAALSARLGGGGLVVTVSGPEKPGLVWPDEQTLLDTFAAAMARDVAPYTDAAVDAPLVADPPAPVGIVARGEDPELGTTTWTLANGVRVVVRPTDFKNDEVLMSAHAPGGTSRLESPAALDRAGMADFVISRAGVGAFDNVALEKKLAGQVVSCAPSIGEHADGFRGRASPRDLATLCQLVYLYATAPREDADAFAAARSMLRSWLANRAADPENALRDTVQVRTTGGDPRQRPFTADDIAVMDLAAMHDFYREVYGDCDDFTFLFVGNVDLDALEPLARTWLGNLPASPRDDHALDHSWPLPAGIVEDVVRAGLEPKSRVQIVFQGEAPWSDGAEYALESMLDCLRIRLRQVVREEKSGTYGVRVGGGWRTIPRDRWRVDVGWGCEPDRVEELTAAVWSVIEELQTSGPDAETLAKVRQTQTRAHETDLQSNRYWLRSLERHQRRGTDPRAILARADEIATLDVVMVREAARRYLTHDEYVEVVLRPESNAP